MRGRLKLWDKHRRQNFEFNCSVFFSKDRTIMSKQSVHFLRNFESMLVVLVRRRCIDACWMASYDVCFGLALAVGFSARAPRFRNSLRGNWLLPPMLDRSSCFHGSILLLWISCHLKIMCILDINQYNPILPVPLCGHKVLSSNDSLHETCIGAHFDYSKIMWEICESLFVFSSLVTGQKWVCRGWQVCCWNHSLSPVYPLHQASPCIQDNQKSAKPILHASVTAP